MIKTGSAPFSRQARARASPSITGILMSAMTMWGFSRSMASRASLPLRAVAQMV